MKKLTLVMAAVAISIMSFAQGTITYELNGGVTNDAGWQNKNDMFTACMTVCGVTTLGTLDEVKAAADPLATICTPLSDVSGMMNSADWDWLEAYIMTVQHTDATATVLVEGTSSAGWRYAVAAFFCESQRTGWPKSADFSVAGGIAAFQPTWKHGFAGPASYDGTADVVIPTPYREGYTFDGWYEAADFSGAKVETIAAGATGNKTLYAKWIEYIPTIAEALAVAEDDSIKTQGVITYQDGKNVWIQDATGGLLVYFKSTPATFDAATKITVKGAMTVYNGNPELKDAYMIASEAGTAVTPTTTTLAAIVADTAAFLSKRVYIEGLRISAYDSYTNPTLTDGIYSFLVYKATMDSIEFPIGTKVNVTLVVNLSNTGALQFRGYVADIEKAPLAGVDPYTYPARGENGEYTLTNEWLISNVLDNLSANPIASTGYARGMAAVDGKMYFPDRENKRLVVVDGLTGEMLEPITLADNIFTYTLYAGTDSAAVKVAGTLAFNDIKVDGAGNILLGNCITSNLGVFQVWKIDLATGAGTLVLQEILAENPDFAEATIRFDAFGVYGDVDNNAVIMAQNANAFEAYRWEITNGVAANATLVEEDITTDTQLNTLTNPGSAPQIFPVDETYFYLDGNATLPTLFDSEGNWADGFQANYTLMKPVNNEGDTCSMNAGHNGICEFQVGDEYFVVMAGTNTAGSPASTFVLYKYQNASKVFAEMTPLWYFPAAGMGAMSNAYRTAMPCVQVDGNIAKIYVYTGENGYGVYSFQGVAATGLNQVKQANLFVDSEGALSETVASAEVYTVAGQKVFAGQNINVIPVAQQGVYIINAVKMNGENAILKYIVK